MDEKKKQAIEEIASIICKETSNKGFCEKCDFKKHTQFGFVYQCSKFDNAENLYNAGYRKIPENAVVITEERNKIICDRFEKLERVQAELQELNAKYYNEAKDLRRELKRVRKKTAEKFAEQMPEKVTEFLEEKLKDGDFVNGKTTLIEFTVAIAKYIVNEICKEIVEGNV